MIQEPESEGEELGGGMKEGKPTAKVVQIKMNERPRVD